MWMLLYIKFKNLFIVKLYYVWTLQWTGMLSAKAVFPFSRHYYTLFVLASWIITLSQLPFLYFSFGPIPIEKGLQFCNCLELYILCIYNKCKLFHMSLFWITKRHHEVWFPFSWDVMLLHWVMGSWCFKTSGTDYPVTWHNFSVTLLWKPCIHKPLDIQLVLLETEIRGTKVLCSCCITAISGKWVFKNMYLCDWVGGLRVPLVWDVTQYNDLQSLILCNFEMMHPYT